MTERDADPAEQLRRLLTDLANDPDAPPSTVTAESVLAAARAAAAEPDTDGSGTDAAGGPGVSGIDAAGGPGGSGPARAEATERDELAARRARRRKTGLTALVAAASVAAIAALVIPLSLSSSGSTSTSALSAMSTSAGEPKTGQSLSMASGAAAGAPSADSAGAVPFAGTAPFPAVPDGVTNPVATSVAASSGAASSSAADAEVAGSVAATAAHCWPPLPDPAVRALLGALPPDAFGSPGPLATGCVPDPIGGAVLPGLAGSEVPTALTVRVQKAEPGACQLLAPAQERCAPAANGVYQRSDASGPSVFAYGGGNQVQVGGSTTASGAAISTGLSQQQLAAVARAVLAAL